MTTVTMDINGGNHNPPPASTQALQQQLSELRPTEDNLNCKKQELCRQLEEIQRDIDATHNAVTTKQSQINQRENSLKPIVTLPAEIHSLIFLHVVSSAQWKTQVTPRPMPLMLSSVCQRWRSVVFGDPRLWTHVTLEHSHRYNLGAYLSRSGDYGLDISFAGKWHTRTETLLRQLGQEAPRWQRLHMDVTEASEGVLPLSSQKRAKSLTYVHLVNRNPDRSAPVSPTFPIHQNHLQTVALIHVPIFKALVAPHLQHLTFIGGWDTGCTADHLWHILSSTTNLRTLRLGVNSIDFPEEEIRRTSLLPHLEYLAFYFNVECETEELVNLFDVIAAPSLQVIEFTATEGLLVQLRAINWGIVPCIKDRCPSVTTAIMYNIISHAEEVQWFIKSFPHIKNLTLDMTGLTTCSNALGEFDQLADVDCQWDVLESIRVRLPPNLADASGMDILCDWLERRQKLGFPTLKLELVMDQDPQGADRWEWLDPLSEWSLMTVAKPSEDADAPWNFLANYLSQVDDDSEFIPPIPF